MSAFFASYSIYSYLPYISVFTGTTAPVIAACASLFYGMISFADQQMINSIETLKDGSNQGKLLIKVSTGPFTSNSIIADVKDIRSILSLSNDDLGEDDVEGNII